MFDETDVLIGTGVGMGYAGALVGASAFMVMSAASLVWRFLEVRAGDRRHRSLRAPSYAVGAVLPLFGVGLVAVALAYGEGLPVWLWAVVGASVGLALATPGAIIVATFWPLVVDWGETRAAINPPWRVTFGCALIVLGVCSCVFVPLTAALFERSA
ncbi:hypothetical protein [Homoserinibacter sp. GY 40078]|uniref:hypothetical protein n=1 Tax=Homoserinibacter sp. GY 40078 TaxID=2603275 RepID=UPI0011D36DFE|nr:hypothetical protein [Homoserinibacter sp. GY 40078]TXK18755.1 hypothetical protein FVQ89_02095 [Homoserinibacter sp. GY 40078]